MGLAEIRRLCALTLLQYLTMASSTFIAPEDDDFFDPGYDSNSTTTSYLTSIASSVRRGVEEYGRTYASFGKHQQAIPQDEEEMDRNDLQHAKFMLLLGDKLHLAPIPEPKNVLDLGTGTGIWAMDMADRHPNAQVVGVDISPTQPTWIPPNCQFQIDDIEEEWPSSTKYDFIFGRELLLTIHDWPRLMQQAYLALKPGGYLELEMTVPRVACSDGSFDVESSTWETAAKCLFEMAAKMGTPLEAVELWKKQLTDIGFEAVEEQILPIPVGSW